MNLLMILTVFILVSCSSSEQRYIDSKGHVVAVSKKEKEAYIKAQKNKQKNKKTTIKN